VLNYPINSVRNRSVALFFIGHAIIFLFLAFAPLSAWSTPVSIQQVLPLPPSVESLSALLNKGQYTSVIQGSRTLLAKNPEAQVFGILSVASAPLNRPEETAKLQKKAKEIGEPRKALLDISRAMILNREGKQDAAIKACRSALKLEPENPLAYLTLGLAYFNKKDYKSAEKNLTQAARRAPNQPTVRYHLGMAYFKNNESEQALKAFHSALRITEKFPEAARAKEMIKKLEEE
jgi:tetratricopeptide (TPR) repeat protein